MAILPRLAWVATVATKQHNPRTPGKSIRNLEKLIQTLFLFLFSPGQSTLLSPSQSTVALNQTASLNASTASTYSPNSTIIHYQTSYLKPSSPITALAHSSVPTAPPITTSASE